MFQAVFTWADAGHGRHRGRLHLAGRPGRPARCPTGWLRSLLVDGVIAGVGSVLVFLPQILILFLFIILLEDFGYMARAAFLMDRIMGGAGLHGRAFIPLLSCFACAIPGIMATRVIDSRRDRLTTILVAPLMTCSARIPVYTLIIVGLHPQPHGGWGFLSLQGLVMFGLYAAGIVSALAVSFVIRRLFWRGAVEPFLMELPTYKTARSGERGAQPAAAGADLPQPRRPDHPAADGAGLVPVHLPAAPAGATRAGHRLQLRRHDRPCDPAPARPHRLQLADVGGADPGHGRPRGGRRRAGHRLRRGRRRGHARHAGHRAGPPVVAGHRPVVPGLVRLRAAVRRDPGRREARDQQLALAVVMFVYMIDPGLSGRLHRLPHRRRPRRGLRSGLEFSSPLVGRRSQRPVVSFTTMWAVVSMIASVVSARRIRAKPAATDSTRLAVS